MAAECMRKKLAPLALNAYPEAYAEFRSALLLLVYSEHEDVSPVASEWSARTRADLAAALSRTLRQAAGNVLPNAHLAVQIASMHASRCQSRLSVHCNAMSLLLMHALQSLRHALSSVINMLMSGKTLKASQCTKALA